MRQRPRLFPLTGVVLLLILVLEKNKGKVPQKRLRVWYGVSDIANIKTKKDLRRGIELSTKNHLHNSHQCAPVRDWTTALHRICVRLHRCVSRIVLTTIDKRVYSSSLRENVCKKDIIEVSKRLRTGSPAKIDACRIWTNCTPHISSESDHCANRLRISTWLVLIMC